MKEISICVIGLGYVGLPLAVEFAKSGVPVLGIDVDTDRIARLKRRESYISDVSDKELNRVIRQERFRVTNDFSLLKHADVVIICVPTPIKRKYHPNISYLKDAVRKVAGNIKKGALVILESSTYPGTTEEIILPLLEKAGLRHNEDFYLCFSPERIDPGNKKFPVNKIPKVVGGITQEAAQMAVSVYKRILDKVVVVSSARTAEAVKLLENTFRLINIGLVDELSMMAHKMGIDIWEVIEAARTKPFGFMAFYPGPGVGGSCIPKDPLYLYWKARKFGFNSRFIKLASEVINYMPEYVVERIEGALSKSGIKLNKAKILIVGVTYKKDVRDLRKSPAIDMIDVLQKRKARISYYDPLIPYLELSGVSLFSLKLQAARLQGFDCVVIATDHSAVNYNLILRNARRIFDTRNVYKNVSDKKIIKL